MCSGSLSWSHGRTLHTTEPCCRQYPAMQTSVQLTDAFRTSLNVAEVHFHSFPDFLLCHQDVLPKVILSHACRACSTQRHIARLSRPPTHSRISNRTCRNVPFVFFSLRIESLLERPCENILVNWLRCTACVVQPPFPHIYKESTP